MNHKELRDAIAAAGGLVAQSDMAKRWGISKARVSELVAHVAFPPAAAKVAGGRGVWIADEVDQWRRAHRPAGRPKGVPTI